MIFQRRKFAMEEKLRILREASSEGVTFILNKYNLSYSVYVKWKHKFSDDNKDNLMIENYATVIQHLQTLKEENNILKRIIADRALLLSMKEEELKGFAMNYS